MEPSSPGSPPRGSGKSRGGWRPQFGLFGLLATMALLSVPFAVWGGLLREGAKPEESPRLMFFVVMAIASPMLVMIAVSAVKPIRRWWRNRRQKEEEERQKAEGRRQKDE
ncbi:MAG: hypothetical protein WD847_03395 [Pirellulales bacterium]